MASAFQPRKQKRDQQLLYALYLTPLTVDQALRWSRTWPQPFPSWKALYRPPQNQPQKSDGDVGWVSVAAVLLGIGAGAAAGGVLGAIAGFFVSCLILAAMSGGKGD